MPASTAAALERAKRLTCHACGAFHRPGRQSEVARDCMMKASAELRVAIEHARAIVASGVMPSPETLLAIFSECGSFAGSVEEFLRAQGQRG